MHSLPLHIADSLTYRDGSIPIVASDCSVVLKIHQGAIYGIDHGLRFLGHFYQEIQEHRQSEPVEDPQPRYSLGLAIQYQREQSLWSQNTIINASSGAQVRVSTHAKGRL